MSYTALEKMRSNNKLVFGQDVGPFPPYGYDDENDHGLKELALRFIHERCEGLKFDLQKEAEEDKSLIYQGTSLTPGQIPYNMQMDINRLCLERELEKFIDSGVAEDAYTVYYCYLEMFFGHYGKSKKMVELLSEFENNDSSLLMKHRDHYSHSVYVFAMGLAIYESNVSFRKKYKEFYGFGTDDSDKEQDHLAARSFLEYWGLASLFHDIGYPFELPFEQVMSYYEVAGEKRGEDSIYLAYRNMEAITDLSDELKDIFVKIYGRRFKTTEELLTFDIVQKLGKAYGLKEEYLLDKIHRKPIEPERFGFFMDHAYFSASRLLRELVNSLGTEKLGKEHIDALSAILLHNSLFKFSISFYKDDEKSKAPLRIDLHPLAYMLMLCDELQCWDRTAYGRNSRTELHPLAADFDLSNNSVNAVYYYDSEEQEKIDEFNKEYEKWEKGEIDKKPHLKAYSDMSGEGHRFVSDIEKIVDTSDIPLFVVVKTKDIDRRNKHTYLSASDFLHLYDFAVSLNGRYSYMGDEKEIPAEQLEKEFEELSLEYQLSNINQAKSFSKYLDAIGCFYTDRPVEYDMISEFTSEQTEVFAPMEHERWIREHEAMGWKKGDLYETLPLDETMIERYGNEKKVRKALREQFRMHKLAMDGTPTHEEIAEHYEQLSEEDKGKDYEPFNSMLKLIKKYDGLRIYRL